MIWYKANTKTRWEKCSTNQEVNYLLFQSGWTIIVITVDVIASVILIGTGKEREIGSPPATVGIVIVVVVVAAVK